MLVNEIVNRSTFITNYEVDEHHQQSFVRILDQLNVCVFRTSISLYSKGKERMIVYLLNRPILAKQISLSLFVLKRSSSSLTRQTGLKHIPLSLKTEVCKRKLEKFEKLLSYMLM